MIVEEQYESSRYSANLITSPPVLHAAFKTVSNAIDLAMIASSTALMQAASVELLQRSTNACVAVNCIRCGQLTMVAGSVTLIQGCERFSLKKDQVCHRSVQPRFWAGNLCQLSGGPLSASVVRSLACAVATYNFTLCCIGSGLYTDAQTLYMEIYTPVHACTARAPYSSQ